ncbi:uncharacterized protein LOC112576235 isoform X4 [Pomacea canaliculata]|uniref:uncharacterized protein LOC112576235 isoform X4 n=1 Tax=Pomacea canaliculata TaxID=400727 RepID=UPI000D738235|nr:uncharacterized protein LOC112576235 isoform X4 [Pomacea canaliculata]
MGSEPSRLDPNIVYGISWCQVNRFSKVSDCDSVKTCRQTRIKTISYHENRNGAITALRFPRNVAICEVAQQALKGERNPAIGRKHSIHSEQTLDSPHEFMVVTLDDLLEPYTIIHPAGTNTGSTDALHHKGSDTIMGEWHHTWSSVDGQLSVDFDNDIEVKREVSCDQEEDLAVSALLEPCPIQGVIENSSQYCCPHQMRLKGKVRSCLNSKVQESGLLLQPKCELQSPKKLTKEKSQCSNSEIQGHTKMSQFVDIKKELKEFDTSGVTQAGDHNSNCKSKRQISKSASDEHPFVNVLSSGSIKKEPQDFETSWNTKSVAQITHRSLESRAETGAYPTGIYHNVHCVEMRTADR